MPFPANSPTLPRNPWLRWALMLLAVVAFIWIERNRTLDDRVPPEAPTAEQSSNDERSATVPASPSASTPPPKTASSDDALIIRNVTLRNQDREVIYRGDVDLRPTIDRIAAGRELRFPNDGSTFQNREGRLPKNPSGYYREWVVPTPGESGPGPQRVVTGSKREAWYTSDHYGSFRKLPNLPTDSK